MSEYCSITSEYCSIMSEYCSITSEYCSIMSEYCSIFLPSDFSRNYAAIMGLMPTEIHEGSDVTNVDAVDAETPQGFTTPRVCHAWLCIRW